MRGKTELASVLAAAMLVVPAAHAAEPADKHDHTPEEQRRPAAEPVQIQFATNTTAVTLFDGQMPHTLLGLMTFDHVSHDD